MLLCILKKQKDEVCHALLLHLTGKQTQFLICGETRPRVAPAVTRTRERQPFNITAGAKTSQTSWSVRSLLKEELVSQGRRHAALKTLPPFPKRALRLLVP